MIDFRYHLVSLVSVFLALAVGIVLGAGPLKENLGNTLKDRVDSLAKERNAALDEKRTAESGIDRREQFVQAVTPSMVAEQLGGTYVVLVTLPGSDAKSLDAMTSALKGAGATVTGHVTVSDEWTDPAKQATRDQVVSDLTFDVPDAARGLDTQAQLGALLARCLVTDQIAQAGQADPASATVCAALRSAKLVSLDGDLTGRATEVVVVAPGTAAASTTTASPSPSTLSPQQVAGSWATLTKSLDDASSGSVVVGPASSATKDGLVGVVRGDATLAKAISTVDTGGTAMAPMTTVLALREQRAGASGAYGFADAATSPLPAEPGPVAP